MATRTSRARASAKLEKPDLLDIYKIMLLARRIDDKEIQLKRQNKIFFQISGAGHEGVLAAASKVLRPTYDWFYTYYRDRALCLGLGMTATEQLLSAVGAADDPNSGGRQMPSHWGHKDLNIVSASSPTGTQFLQAVGCAEAWLRYTEIEGIEGRDEAIKGDEVVLCTTGDGTTSEGEFWEALSTACNLKLPVVFLVEDNGYAISVPVEVNTPGGSISKLLTGFPGLFIQEVDGCDVLASFDTMVKAVDYARARKGPALVHAHVIRPYSHSLSDDEVQYRSPAERQADAERDPLTRFPKHLLEQGIATQAELDLDGTAGGGGSAGRRGRGARLAPAGPRHRLQVRLFARRGPHLGAVRHRGRSPVHRRSHDHGGPAQHLPPRRDDAGPPDRRLRRGRR